MSKNILTINNSERIAPFEHVRIEGVSADCVKSFTVGERAYVLADIDAQKEKIRLTIAERYQNYESWQKSVKVIAELREQLDRGWSAHSALAQDARDLANETVSAIEHNRPIRGAKNSRHYSLLDKHANFVCKGSALRRYCEFGLAVAAVCEQPAQARVVFATAAETSRAAQDRAALLDALDEAGKNARAEGYAINAADKIAEQIRLRMPR
jgi:hypothetical protein